MFGIKFSQDRKNPVFISFKTMRLMVGIMGMALPVVLLLWSGLLVRAPFLLDSISAYYHTNLRDIFVGILCAVSFFLFAYHGYDKWDFFAFKTASLSALGVAFFPAFIKSPVNPYVHIAPNVSAATNLVHYASPAVFFTTLAAVSLFLFTKTDAETRKRGLDLRKRVGNAVYVSCGLTMVACLALLLALLLLPDGSPVFDLEPAFWLELVALFAFGISWLVKGALSRKRPAAD